jgi:hypothetical protein
MEEWRYSSTHDFRRLAGDRTDWSAGIAVDLFSGGCLIRIPVGIPAVLTEVVHGFP